MTTPRDDLTRHLATCMRCRQGESHLCAWHAGFVREALAPRTVHLRRRRRSAVTPLAWVGLVLCLLSATLVLGVLYHSCQQVMQYYQRPIIP